MVDSPTGSLWSHILGEAMEGKLKGRQLEAIPCEMITWRAWRAAHPKTTVLNLSRTHRDYTKEFYDRPAIFVFGWVAGGTPYHCPLDVLLKKRLVNCTCGQFALLVTFDATSTAARLFSRRVDDKVLDFVLEEDNRMRDTQTGSSWDSNTGVALQGPLEGKRLEHQVGIMSYARAWKVFHPGSVERR